jgi:hypothetical protein
VKGAGFRLGAVRLGSLLLASALVLGCGAAGPATTATPTSSIAAATLTSPVTGVLTAIDATSLSDVRGFTLRTADGAETTFRIGVLENGAQFAPGHLAEHMGTSEPVRVFFRVVGGERVVYRLEDGSSPVGS